MNGNTITKAWTKEEIANKLETSYEWQKHALLAIFDRQTETEQMAERTEDLNGRGFSGFDAELLTSFAKQLQTRGFLSPKQQAILGRRIQKYAGQLTKIANGEL